MAAHNVVNPVYMHFVQFKYNFIIIHNKMKNKIIDTLTFYVED